MKSYRLFMFMARVTRPFRIIGVMLGRLPSIAIYNDYVWAICWLFRGDKTHSYYQRSVVYAIAMLESRHFKSKVCLNNTNCFGMGKTKNSPYQDGFVVGKVGDLEPDFAVYANPYRCVYDFYDYCFRRHQIIGRTMQVIPGQILPEDSDAFKGYVANVIYGMHEKKYFMSDWSQYAEDCWDILIANKHRALGYRTNNVVALVLYSSAFVLLGLLTDRGKKLWAKLKTKTQKK